LRVAQAAKFLRVRVAGRSYEQQEDATLGMEQACSDARDRGA
jgi:hypothetical protein